MDEDFGSYNEQQEMRYRHCLTEMQTRMQQIQEQQKAQIRLFLQQQVVTLCERYNIVYCYILFWYCSL